jgi:hypothetical protein
MNEQAERTLKEVGLYTAPPYHLFIEQNAA